MHVSCRKLCFEIQLKIVFLFLYQIQATSSAPRAKPINFIAMLAAMDNIQEEQPGANTPWIAYDLRMLEDEISVKVRRSPLDLSFFDRTFWSFENDLDEILMN